MAFPLKSLERLLETDDVDEILGSASGSAAWYLLRSKCGDVIWPLQSSPGRRLSNPRSTFEVVGQQLRRRNWVSKDKAIESIFERPISKGGRLVDFEVHGALISEQTYVLRPTDGVAREKAVVLRHSSRVLVADWAGVIAGWRDLDKCRVRRTVTINGALLGTDGPQVECLGSVLKMPRRGRILDIGLRDFVPRSATLTLTLEGEGVELQRFVSNDEDVRRGPLAEVAGRG